jgi:hypothetical protein
MRAHLSPSLAASSFPAARTAAQNERPVASRITSSHRAHGSNGFSLIHHREPDPASDDVSLDHERESCAQERPRARPIPNRNERDPRTGRCAWMAALEVRGSI